MLLSEYLRIDGPEYLLDVSAKFVPDEGTDRDVRGGFHSVQKPQVADVRFAGFPYVPE